MLIPSRFFLVAAGLLALGGVVSHTWAASNPAPFHSPETALDRYVAQPDASFAWKVAATTNLGRCQVTVIDLTSQTWLTTNEVNRTLWKHWLTVARPKELAHKTALLVIAGGANREGELPKPSAELTQIAEATRSVVVELKMIPNQTLIFHRDGKERVEDDLIAYTWDQFLRTGDARWPARLPMTKSVVRAMDAVSAFTATPAGGAQAVETYVVAGGSKRGWTTWTTAAVDKRVVALCPIVIDMLNIEPSFKHHFQAYGTYAPAVGNYVEQGIMNWQGTPEYRALMKIEEPFEYRDRLTQPKLIMNACGDQFFLPDSSQFYFDELQGTKYLRYIPNTDHSLKGSDAYPTLMAWHHATINRTALPRFTWKQEAPGRIRVQATDAPKSVKLWQAHNPKARDFRLETIGAAWSSTDLTPAAQGQYVGQITPPSAGWTAAMVELTYDLGAAAPLKFTTAVYVTPDRLPFAPDKPELRVKGFLSR